MVAIKSLFAVAIACAVPALCKPISHNCDMISHTEWIPKYYDNDEAKANHLDVVHFTVGNKTDDDKICRSTTKGEWTFTFLLDTDHNDFLGTEHHKSTGLVIDDKCVVQGIYTFKPKDCGPEWRMSGDFFPGLSLIVTFWRYFPATRKDKAKVDYSLAYGAGIYDHPHKECYDYAAYNINAHSIRIMSCPVTFPIEG